jgi:predicted AlkP superfamily phosphohydrolase/phosphomutase
MFWRFLEERHPALRDRANTHADVIRDMYRKMDDLVGRTMRQIGPDTTLIVMSDHGFTSFRRGVDLNAWLRDHGYLQLKNGAKSSQRIYLNEVDWSRTRAYAIGLAGIFINEAGRESQGIVPAGAVKRQLVEEIAERLSGFTDPESGDAAIREALPRERVYSGPYLESAPDVIVGYTHGYRVSWDAAVGKTGAEIFSDNKKAWSGDHCIHPDLVPGVLFSSCALDPERSARIVDIAPTVLELLGVDRPPYMDGSSLL